MIVPRSLKNVVLTEVHSSISGGHLGVAKTTDKIRQRYYWSGQTADIRTWCEKCTVCGARKMPPKRTKGPLQQMAVGAPMERIAIDVVGPLPESKSGNKVIVVVVDYFTKWVEAFALPIQEAELVTERLVENVICRFGVPHEIHSDQGRNFESRVFQETCRLMGIMKTRTTPFNPKSDGLVERMNRTLVQIISKLIDPDRNQDDWDEPIAYALMAYRSSVQQSTGETPNMMMLGREIELPLDVIIEKVPGEEIAETVYVEALRERMKAAWDRAQQALKLSARRQKKIL